MARFLKFVVNIILLASIIVAGALLIPMALGTTTVMVDSTEMVTTLPLGSVTYATKVNATDLKVGDLVIKEDASGNNVYEIISADTTSGSFELKDKYDTSAETKTATLRNSVSKVVLTVPYIAYVVMAMQSIEGIIIIALIVIFVVILFILAELWKKSDEEEEDAEEYGEELEESQEPIKSKRQMKKERKEQKKLDKQREKEYARAEKLARKNGGVAEDYMENQNHLEPQSESQTTLQESPFELPKIDISSVTDLEDNSEEDSETVESPTELLEELQEEVNPEETIVEETTPEEEIVEETVPEEEIVEETASEEEIVEETASEEVAPKEETAEDIMASLASELAKSVGEVKEEKEDVFSENAEEELPEEEESELEEAELEEAELEETKEDSEIEDSEKLESEPEDFGQTREVVLEEVVEDQTAPKKMVIPKYSAKELLDKAEADGDKPRVIEEKDFGITLLDYSDIVK